MLRIVNEYLSRYPECHLENNLSWIQYFNAHNCQMISVKNATEVETIGIFKKNKQSIILMHSENTGHKIYQ